ncbi:MAG: calcium-binding protein [Candidatus Binataceae bacterium]
MKKWDFFAEARNYLTGPLQGVNVSEATHHLGRTTAVPLSHLAAVKVDRSTADAIGDWHYWVA